VLLGDLKQNENKALEFISKEIAIIVIKIITILLGSLKSSTGYVSHIVYMFFLVLGTMK